MFLAYLHVKRLRLPTDDTYGVIIAYREVLVESRLEHRVASHGLCEKWRSRNLLRFGSVFTGKSELGRA